MKSSYRFRATFRRRWAGYLTLVVLIGLVGGVAMAAVAGARRTQSSFPTYLASTNPSDLGMFTEFGPVTHKGYSQKVVAAVARAPFVERAVPVVGFDGTLQVLGRHTGTGVPGEAPPALEGSTGPDAAYYATDRVTVVQGRMANPARTDELVMSAGAAAQYGLRIGSTLPVAFFTDAQASQPNFSGYPRDKPHLIVPFKLVGIVEWDTQVVRDDDAALGNQIAVITPALTRQLETCCAFYSYVSFHLVGGLAHEAAVVSAVNKVIPDLGPVAGSTTSAPYVAKAERAIRPEPPSQLRGVRASSLPSAAGDQWSGRQPLDPAEQLRKDQPCLRPGGRALPWRWPTGCSGSWERSLPVRSWLGGGRRGAVPTGPDRLLSGPSTPDLGVAFDWSVPPVSRVPLVRRGAQAGTALLVAFRVARRTGWRSGRPGTPAGPWVGPGRRGRASPQRGAGHPISAGRTRWSRHRTGALCASGRGDRDHGDRDFTDVRIEPQRPGLSNHPL